VWTGISAAESKTRQESVILDPTGYSIKALGIDRVHPNDADFAFQTQHPVKILRIVCRYFQNAYSEFSWNEEFFRKRKKTDATNVLRNAPVSVSQISLEKPDGPAHVGATALSTF
jgi:hypothetical protein